MPRTTRLFIALLPVGAMLAAILVLPGAASHAEDAAASDPQARAALDRVVRIFSTPTSARPVDGVGPSAREASAEATLALTELFAVLPRLSAPDQVTARGLLARPTDGAADPQGSGYQTTSKRICSANICVHYVTSTTDAVPSLSWATTNLQSVQSVYNLAVGKLGYRAPAREPNLPGTGGDGKFDVYLKDIGLGVYGYCAPEYRVRGTRDVASGYCVLDNDFARSQFGGANPTTSMRVTAAHEFFHAIQFAYDFREDPWFMESTATWMEERYADEANDNRRYLERSQVRSPFLPLDRFEAGGTYHYGQWAFWEYLSQRFGNKIVRSTIGRAAEQSSGANRYSLRALQAALKKRGGLSQVFTAYAAANTMPRRTYAEGGAWPSSQLALSRRLSSRSKIFRGSFRLDHLSSTSISLAPGRGLANRRWRIRVAIDGPARRTSPAAYVTVAKKRGGLIRKPIRLSKSGAGRVTMPFSKRAVARAVVTVANVSTRTRCGQNTPFACQGTPRDDNRSFRVKVSAVPQ